MKDTNFKSQFYKQTLISSLENSVAMVTNNSEEYFLQQQQQLVLPRVNNFFVLFILGCYGNDEERDVCLFVFVWLLW